jgi:hypothetical protein
MANSLQGTLLWISHLSLALLVSLLKHLHPSRTMNNTRVVQTCTFLTMAAGKSLIIDFYSIKHFLTKSTEVRNRIIELCHGEIEPSKNMKVDGQRKYTVMPRNILDTCYQLRDERAGHYHLSNTSIVPLCHFAQWVKDMDCKMFPIIQKIRIQIHCKNLACTECSILAIGGATQCRDFLPLLKFATEYLESCFSFTMPLECDEMEPKPQHETVALGPDTFSSNDYFTANSWYECLFIWAKLRGQGEYRRPLPWLSIGDYFKKTLKAYDEKFEEMAERYGETARWDDRLVAVWVDVFCKVRGLDMGEGMPKVERLAGEFTRWLRDGPEPVPHLSIPL